MAAYRLKSNASRINALCWAISGVYSNLKSSLFPLFKNEEMSRENIWFIVETNISSGVCWGKLVSVDGEIVVIGGEFWFSDFCFFVLPWKWYENCGVMFFISVFWLFLAKVEFWMEWSVDNEFGVWGVCTSELIVVELEGSWFCWFLCPFGKIWRSAFLNEVVEWFLLLFGEAIGSVAVLGAKSFDEELHADECSVFSFWTFFGELTIMSE